MRHQKIILDFSYRLDVKSFNIMCQKLFISLEKESHLIIDLRNVNSLLSFIKSEILLWNFLLVNNRWTWGINVGAHKTLKFMFIDFLSSFKFTILTTSNLTQVTYYYCRIDCTTITFSEIFLLLPSRTLFIRIIVMSCSEIVSYLIAIFLLLAIEGLLFLLLFFDLLSSLS